MASPIKVKTGAMIHRRSGDHIPYVRCGNHLADLAVTLMPECRQPSLRIDYGTAAVPGKRAGVCMNARLQRRMLIRIDRKVEGA